MIIKRLLICFAWACSQLLVTAALFDEKIEISQPDGTRIALRGQGDEFHSVYETTDGYTVTLDPETGFYHYASLSPEGDKLIPTGPRVGTADPSESEIPKHLRVSEEARARQILEERVKWNKETHGWREKLREFCDAPLALSSVESEAKAEASPQPQSQPIAPISIVALTILVDFSDDPATISRATLDNLLNSPSGNSVRKFYSDNSNGLVTYTNILTLYVRVARSKADYALIGQASHNLKIDAIDALKALPNYQTEILPTLSGLTKLDNNHIFCNVFYTGGTGPMGAQMGYAAEQDLGGNLIASGFTVQPIGNGTSFNTFAHESGHLVFGFPDLYDYNPTYKGAGVFCLMSSGGNLSPPAQICAYLKAKAGWATVTDITSGSFLTATVGAQGSARFNHFYRYKRPGSDTEYFIIENRQKQGQDAALYGQGVFIWHVDELGNNSRPNLLPNATHNNYELSLEQADNLFQLQNSGSNWGDANDPYYNGNPAAAYAGVFDDFSAPSAKWWDGNPSGMHLSNFSSNGTEMTFQVGNPQSYVIGKDATLVREGYAPANHVIDPGETVTVRFNVRNAGFSSSSNAVVTLLAQGGVSSPDSPQSLGTLAAQTDTYVDFSFTANAALGEQLSTVIQIAEASKVYGSFSNSFTIGEMRNSFWTQNFDSVTAPNLPSGWTTSASVGTAALWKSFTAVRDTPPNSAFVAEGGGSDSTVALTSPVVAIAHSSTQLSFRHSYNTERDAVGTYGGGVYGGGVLEIKIGSDPWQDVVTAGGTWVTNGYNVQNLDASYGNPLGYRSAWGGVSNGFITTLVNLPLNVGGKNVQFRWLYGYDHYAPWDGSVGWYVDTVSLIGPVAVSPTVEVSPRNDDFGSAAVGQTITRSFVATNTGTQSISGTISVAAPFSIVGSTSFNLAPNASTTVNVIFAPITEGAYAESLVFSSSGNVSVSPILAGIGITVSGSDRSTPWSPHSLGLLAWYDAADTATITSNGSAVSQWKDKGGYSYHATQSTPLFQPILAVGGIQFGSNNAHLIMPKMVSDAYSILMVLKNNDTIHSSSAAQMPLSIEVLSNGPAFGSSTGAYANEVISMFDEDMAGIFADRESASSTQVASISNAPHLFSFVLNQNWHIGLDGSNDKRDLTAGSRHPFLTSHQVGAIGTNIRKRTSDNILEHAWTGLISEVILLPTAASLEDRQKIEGYLAHKWDAINGNTTLVTALPQSHPWKYVAPESGYRLWAGASRYNLSGGPNDDDDGDGFSNFQEFAFATHPAQADGVSPVIMEPTGGSLVVRYQRTVNSGLAYTVWTSTDLTTWQGPATVNPPVLISQENGTEIIEVSVTNPPDSTTLFLRVKAE